MSISNSRNYSITWEGQELLFSCDCGETEVSGKFNDLLGMFRWQVAEPEHNPVSLLISSLFPPIKN